MSQSRSVRRRNTRRRPAVALTNPPSQRGVLISLKTSEADISRSFLIMTGDTLAVTLDGYVADSTGWKQMLLPVTIKASIA